MRLITTGLACIGFQLFVVIPLCCMLPISRVAASQESDFNSCKGGKV